MYGIDISSQLAKMTSQKAGREEIRPKLCVADVRRLAFKDDRFDLIISTSTLDHFPEIDVALKELYRNNPCPSSPTYYSEWYLSKEA